MAFYSFLFSFLLIPFFANAAFVGPPSSSAGVVERELQKEYEESEEFDVEKPIPFFEVEIPEKKCDFPMKGKIYLQKIELEGNTLLSDEELECLIAPYLCREVSLSEIPHLCKEIQDAYRKKGYFLVRVYLPPQEIRENSLRIGIVEGKLGKISVVGNQSYSSRYISGYFSRLRGKPLSYQELMEALLLLNENRDLGVGAVFKKGEEVGTADLILRVKDQRPLHFYLDVNNYGSSPITLNRSGIREDFGNLFTSGDCLSVTDVVGFPIDGLCFIDGRYTIPLNRRGTRLDISYLYNSFRVNQFNELGLHGLSQVAGGRISHPLKRTKRFAADLSLSFEYKQLKNYGAGQLASYDRLRVFTLLQRCDYIDCCKGRSWVDLSLGFGVPNFLGGMHAVDPLCSRQGAGGRFYLFNFNGKRIQQLPWESFLFLNFSGQYSFNPLPLAEQIYIGGVDTVRGFPLAVGLGDMGYYANFELRIPPPFLKEKQVPFLKKRFAEFLQLIAFVDQGGVFSHQRSASFQPSLSLTSAGIGFRAYGPKNFDVNFDAGFPLTDKGRSSSVIYYFKVGWRLL